MAKNEVMASVSNEMLRALEQEKKARKLATVPEAIRGGPKGILQTKDAKK